MASDSSSDAQLELAHVLFIDIVGYSKRLINQQTALVKRLNELVLQTEQCRKADAAGKLIRIPTGDGMALAFFTSPDAPVRSSIGREPRQILQPTACREPATRPSSAASSWEVLRRAPARATRSLIDV